jgi:hypothetical protein
MAFVCLLLSHGIPARADAAKDREFIADRVRRLSNLTVEYDRVTFHDPDPGLPLPPEVRGHVKPPVARVETFGERVTLRPGNLLIWSERSKADCDAARAAGDPISRVEAKVITPTRGETLTLDARSTRAAGSIGPPRRIPFDLAIDMALGLRLENSEHWLTSDDLPGGAIQPTADPDRVVLQFKAADGMVHSFTHSRRNGYAVERYHVDYPRPAEVEDFVCSDFRRVDGVVLPFRIQRQSTYNDTSGKPRHPIVTTLTVRRYTLDRPPAAAAPLAMPWPKGASVLDLRHNLTFEVQNDGEFITEQRIADALKEREAGQKESEERTVQKVKENGGSPGEQDKARAR